MNLNLWTNLDAYTDKLLATLWNQTNAERLKDLVFYEGCKTFTDFALLMSNVTLLYVTDGCLLAGYIWLTNLVLNQSVEANFCFFKEFCDGKLPRKAATKALDVLFAEDGFNLKVVHGRILTRNKPALRFVQRLGFDVVGHVFNGKDSVTVVELKKQHSSRCEQDSEGDKWAEEAEKAEAVVNN